VLNPSDSRTFGRTLAALGLVAGPILLLLASLLDSAWSADPAQYLQQVADSRERYLTAGVFWTLGALFLVAGALGAAKLMRGRGVTLGQLGAWLIAFGTILFSAAVGFNGIDVVLADFPDRQAAVALFDGMENNPFVTAYYFIAFLGGIVLGSVLLAIALFRRRIVPIWSPILLVVSTVLGFLGGEMQLLTALSLLLLAVALFPLAMRIWSLTDESWGRWEPLGGGAPGS
jgi:hypothetical protein